MKIFKTMLLGISLIALLSVNAYAGDTHSGRAVTHSGQASVHSAEAAAHGSVGAVQVTSGAVAVPLYVIGSVGALSTHVADELMEVATTPIGEPLEITDETVTAGPPPDKVLANQKENI